MKKHIFSITNVTCSLVLEPFYIYKIPAQEYGHKISFNFKFPYFKVRMCQIMFHHLLLMFLYQDKKVSGHVYVN